MRPGGLRGKFYYGSRRGKIWRLGNERIQHNEYVGRLLHVNVVTIYWPQKCTGVLVSACLVSFWALKWQLWQLNWNILGLQCSRSSLWPHFNDVSIRLQTCVIFDKPPFKYWNGVMPFRGFTSKKIMQKMYKKYHPPFSYFFTCIILRYI